MPMSTEKDPIKKLIMLLKKKLKGKSFAKITFMFKNMLIATTLTIVTKIIINMFPFIELAKIAPKMEPVQMPRIHFFKTLTSIFLSL